VAEQPVTEGKPIRVVMFGGGPVLEAGVKEFLARLEAHAEIELLGAFCQSEGQSFRDVVRDLWRRRRWLALPLLLWQLAGRLLATLRRSGSSRELDEQVARMASRIHYVTDIHADEVLAQVRELRPELGLIYGSPILKPELFEIPAMGTLGIHHGQVPQYRGKKTTFWAMYNGEPQAGVTIQKINAGLDTGEIVNSGSVAACGRSYSAVWNELEELGLDLYIRSILEVKAGTAQVRPQDGPKGKLYRDPQLADIARFWWRQARRRGGKPGHGDNK
jgi:folate-dependent phosphoribosylglycinamide formyltransferase PurN